MHRNRLVAGSDLQLDAVVFQQQLKLLQKIVVVQVGPGQRGFIATGAGDEAEAFEGTLRARRGHARHGVGVQPHERVAGAHPQRVVRAFLGRAGAGFASDKGLHGLAQVGQAGVVDQVNLGQRGSGIGMAGRGDERGQIGHGLLCNGRVKGVAASFVATPSMGTSGRRAGPPQARPAPSGGQRSTRSGERGG